VGLYLVLPGWGLEWPWWGYVLVALALIPIVLGVNYWMMILGDKEL
jgi:formate hydrogenlyase subunit 3/multisubunit Na+/H+ antiporter MnhD subunit